VVTELDNGGSGIGSQAKSTEPSIEARILALENATQEILVLLAKVDDTLRSLNGKVNGVNYL
jgi:hypothetical protein